MRKIALPALLLLASCSLIPGYERPALDIPQKWPAVQGLAPAAEALPSAWWKEFNDPTLTELTEEGLAANDDLFRAAARISEARAVLGGRQADRLPIISGEAGAARTSASTETYQGALPSGTSKPFNAFSLAAVLDYEVDLWGRLQSATEAARADLLASEAARDAIRLSVASEIATGYFNLRALDAQIAVTEQTIQSRKESLRYQKAQYRSGAVDKLTYKQAESELEAARAELPMLVQSRTEQQSALGVLLGRSPKEIAERAIAKGTSPDAMPNPPAFTDVPSSLLERRADIRAAEQNLIAANADIGEARADYFPRLSLTALLGLSSSDADKLLRASARNWQAGANLAGPLIDFGRTTANVEATEARRDQALADYRQTVRQAFKEATDAMSGNQNAIARTTAEAAQVNARTETLRLANLRYKAGYVNHLEVLDAERFLYTSQLSNIAARRDRLTALVTFYKSLGGGLNQ